MWVFVHCDSTSKYNRKCLMHVPYSFWPVQLVSLLPWQHEMHDGKCALHDGKMCSCTLCQCTCACWHPGCFHGDRKYRDKTGTILYAASFLTYMSGFTLWNIDNIYCQNLRSVAPLVGCSGWMGCEVGLLVGSSSGSLGFCQVIDQIGIV